MAERAPALRLRQLPQAAVLGHRVPVASGFWARLLGLSFLSRADAGSGLLIPHCRSVHTFGMRFSLDLVFLDECGGCVSTRRAVPRRRIVFERGAAAVLELPSPSDRVR